MIKIKNFVKKHETKILITTIIGGSIISAVLAKKITKNKMLDLGNEMQAKIELNFRTKEEIMEFILNASENDKFAIFKEKETDLFEIVDL